MAQEPDIFWRKKKVQGGSIDWILTSTPPVPAPAESLMNSELTPWSPRGREWVVLFCSLGYFLTYGSSQLEVQGRPLGRLNPQLGALSYDTEAKLKNYCDLLQWRISSGKQVLNRMAKWSMTSSSRSSPFLCGTTEREGKRATPGPEHSDWWVFEKKNVPFTCGRWQTQQDDKPNSSKRTTRKQNDSGYGISMSLIKFLLF